MDGVVSLLPEPYYSTVEKIWHELTVDCGVRGIQATPVPHFSWHVALHYDENRLRENLTAVAQRQAPLTVHTAGLGVFSGDLPIVYISLVKDRSLLEFHEHVWKAADAAASGGEGYYAPAMWMPHITLVFQDLCLDNLPCIGEKLLFREFNWEMKLDNLALIGQPDGQAGSVYFRIPWGA